MEAGSAALFLLWIGKQVLEGEIKIRWNPLFLPMGVFGLLIVSQLVFRSTAYPHDTVSLALLYFCYAMLCFLAGQTLLRGSQARSLAMIFSLYGAALAAFALLHGISSNGKLYWFRLPRNGGWIYGPYVNHNHYAGLMEMLVPIPLVLSLTRRWLLSRPAPRPLPRPPSWWAPFFFRDRAAACSRLSPNLSFWRSCSSSRNAACAPPSASASFLTIVVGLLVWVGGGELSQRIATVGLSHAEISSDTRLDINRDGLRMFLKKPVLGWGLGTFPVVYPQFRTFYTNFFVNQAHNDYLQLLVEMGLLGFATMLWFLLTLYTRAIKKMGNWTAEVSGAVTLACVLGLSGILVHSAVDFNLQIPANAALFYVLCTIAASEPFAQPARKRRVVRSNPAEILASPETLQQPATNF